MAVNGYPDGTEPGFFQLEEQGVYEVRLPGTKPERPDQIAIAYAAQVVIYRNGETGRVYPVSFTDEELAAFERIEAPEQRVGYVRERIPELLRDADISN